MYYYTDGKNYLALFEQIQEQGYTEITKQQFDAKQEEKARKEQEVRNKIQARLREKYSIKQ